MWQVLSANNCFKKLISHLGLFASFGTLICCAIPSTLVLLGFGASLAGFLSKYPQLIWLSEHKEWVFGLSFSMLGLSYIMQKHSQRDACPIDSAAACQRAKSWSRPLLWLALGINLVGAFYAFLLPGLL